MFKYLILFILLVGCGAPQTPTEISVDNMLHNFMDDCESVYKDRCNISMVVHSLTESAHEQTCWIEDSNPIRQVAVYKKFVSQENKIAVYELLFECGLNLGTPKSKLLKFDKFALMLGLR